MRPDRRGHRSQGDRRRESGTQLWVIGIQMVELCPDCDRDDVEVRRRTFPAPSCAPTPPYRQDRPRRGRRLIARLRLPSPRSSQPPTAHTMDGCPAHCRRIRLRPLDQRCVWSSQTASSLASSAGTRDPARGGHRSQSGGHAVFASARGGRSIAGDGRFASSRRLPRHAFPNGFGRSCRVTDRHR